eukprot:UN01918
MFFILTCIVTFHLGSLIITIIHLPGTLTTNVYNVLTTSDLIKPSYLFDMTRNIYNDVNGFFRPSYSTNFTSELTKTLEQINLNPEELSSLSTSLLQSSNVLNDLPVVVQVYPSEEVRTRCEKFRADVRKLSKNLRQGYKHT